MRFSDAEIMLGVTPMTHKELVPTKSRVVLS
jgi:hypothetical protein